MKLYYAPRTHALKVLWLLYEMDLEFDLDVRALARNGHFHAQDVPGGKFPALEDGSISLCESGAILEYLISRYPTALAPGPTSGQWPQLLFWVHYAGATVFPVFQNISFHSFQLDSAMRAPQVVENETPWAHDILTFIDDKLNAREFLLGDDFTAADVPLAFACFMAKRCGLLDAHPVTSAWLDRIETRPALVKALAVDHPR